MLSGVVRLSADRLLRSAVEECLKFLKFKAKKKFKEKNKKF